MNEADNKIIDKIEKLIALSSSDNENEAKAAMLKAQELMAKYEIEMSQINPDKAKERPVVSYTSPSFRLKFYGFDEDAQISINIFNYAVKVIRRRMATLRAIYAEAGREFGRNEKMNYVEGFNAGLHQNFEDQKKQSEAFALACLVPAEVNAFVDEIPGMEEYQNREFERSREHDLLRQYGYIDGKNFQNAGDKERLAE